MSRQSKDVTTAAGNLLTTPGIVALAGVFLLAAWYSQAGILLLTGLFLSTAGLARIWNWLSLAGVQAQRQLNGTRYFPGEPIVCKLRLFNRKPLPLPWVQIENDLPEGVRLDQPVGRSGSDAIRRSASLLWYRGITWNLRLSGGRRGYYPIGPMKITSGDVLGMYSRSRRSGTTEHLIVYPKIFPVDTGCIPSLHPTGEFQAARRLIRDPTHTIGVREYLRSDSLKFIHILARPPDALSDLVPGLKSAGLNLLLLLVGGHAEPKLPPDTPWFRVRHAEDLAGGPRP